MFKNKLKLIGILAVLVLGAGTVYASGLQFTADYTVDLSSPDINLTILSGSEADSVITGEGDLKVIAADGKAIIVTSVSRGLTVTGNTTSDVNQLCEEHVAKVIITGGSDGETITLTPTSQVCSVGGGSGGGGGGSGGGGGGGGGSNNNSNNNSTASTTASSSTSVGATTSGPAPSDCLPGYKFSPSTGKSCAGAVVSTGGQTTVHYQFTQNLTIGNTGPDVVALQTFLVQKGFLVMPAGVSMGYFGPLTQTALAKFQASVSISPAVGYFGPITRAYLNGLVM